MNTELSKNEIQAIKDITGYDGFFHISELTDIRSIFKGQKLYKLHDVRYYNTACSFDIETSSWTEGEDKKASMYLWQICLNGRCYYGRHYYELTSLISRLQADLGLSKEKRLCIYVHNLSYEFQFLRGYFTWLNVFALDNRKVCYAVTDSGIEFRCSYCLSGTTLAQIGKQLTKYKAQKAKGDLDYRKLRHSETPLTNEELHYAEMDVRVLAYYIQEKIEQDGRITKIPYTKTGYVRRATRNNCLYGNHSSHRNAGANYYGYAKFIHNLNLTVDTYLLARRGYTGGFTHCALSYSGRIMYDVTSMDFTSSYPAVMVMEDGYPMSSPYKAEITSRKQFNYLNEYYATVFDVELRGVRAIRHNEHPLSFSKCRNTEKAVCDNGRIISCEHLFTTFTNVDWQTFTEYYEFDEISIGEFMYFKRGYLPKRFVQTILDFYHGKTTLKDVVGGEVEYQLKKELLNSAYGMTVTDIIRMSYKYDNISGWYAERPENIAEEIEKENNKKNRFLYYLWGVFVTAFARRNLFDGISALGSDYIYSDTDSVKFVNYDAHKAYFESYNAEVVRKCDAAMAHHNLDPELTRPKTVKGKVKQLGVWDFDSHYTRFKSNGAKRYMVEYDDGSLSLTVSGVNKHTAIPYLRAKYGSNDAIFAAFTDGLVIPEFNDTGTPIQDSEGLEIDCPSGKMTHTYIDMEISGTVRDYLGTEAEYHELSYIHLANTSYSMTLSTEYRSIIRKIQLNEVA